MLIFPILKWESLSVTESWHLKDLLIKWHFTPRIRFVFWSSWPREMRVTWTRRRRGSSPPWEACRWQRPHSTCPHWCWPSYSSSPRETWTLSFPGASWCQPDHKLKSVPKKDQKTFLPGLIVRVPEPVQSQWFSVRSPSSRKISFCQHRARLWSPLVVNLYWSRGNYLGYFSWVILVFISFLIKTAKKMKELSSYTDVEGFINSLQP